MKKSLLAGFLALMLATTASAYVARTNTYDNQFSDLTTESVFYDNVVALYEYGLSVGKADGTYDLSGELTVGEAIIFSARVRSLLTTGTTEAAVEHYRTEGQTNTEPYYLYLQTEAGLEADLSLYEPASRALMAHILVQAIPSDAISAINQEAVTVGYAMGGYITDVSEYTPYYQDILTLYKWGISAGYDDMGSYRPDSTITRGATAAFVTRLVDEDLRITLLWNLDSTTSAQGTTLSQLITPGNYIVSPTTWEEMDETVRYMLSNDANTMVLVYDSLDSDTANTYMNLALSVVKSYCEQGYNAVGADYYESGMMKMIFRSTYTIDDAQIAQLRTDSMEAAIAVHDQLWSNGTITADMTELEIAWVYYCWIVDNVDYDYSAADDSLSHLPYRALVEGFAVCDGYSGAYNMLLKLEGIDCYGMVSTTHMWTVATLDGTQYHIDTTWGDTENAGDNYFAMSEATAQSYYNW